MSLPARLGTVLGFVATLAACSNSDLVAPAPIPTPATAPQGAPSPVPPRTTDVPLLTGPRTRYHFSGPLLHPVRAFTTLSEFVLYDNGAFSLHFPSSPAGGATLVGVYAREGDTIGLRFVPGMDHEYAVGTVRGNLLEIRYSERMVHADFEDAVYSRAP